MVRKASVPAGSTKEETLTGTVGFLNMAADWTEATGVARVNRDYYHPGPLRLVREKATELSEGPVGKLCPLPPSNRDPLAYAAEFFDGEGAMGAFGVLHNRLADLVIHILLIASLLAAKLLQFATGRVRALALQIATAVGKGAARFLDSFARVDRAVAIGEDIDHSEVATEHALHIPRFSFLDITGTKKIPLALDEGEVRLSLLVLEKILLARSTHELDSLAAGDGPDGDFRGGEFPSQYPRIIGDRTGRAERALGLPVEFVGVTDLGFGAHHHLGTEGEEPSGLMVASAVNVVLAEDSMPPGPIREPIAESIGLLHSLAEGLRLLFCWTKLYLSSQLHDTTIPYQGLSVKLIQGPLPPRTEVRGIRGGRFR